MVCEGWGGCRFPQRGYPWRMTKITDVPNLFLYGPFALRSERLKPENEHAIVVSGYRGHDHIVFVHGDIAAITGKRVKDHVDGKVKADLDAAKAIDPSVEAVTITEAAQVAEKGGFILHVAMPLDGESPVRVVYESTKRRTPSFSAFAPTVGQAIALVRAKVADWRKQNEA